MVVRTFEELDDATRVNAIMRLPDAEREEVMVALLLETNRDIRELKKERRWLYGAGHAVAIVIASVLLMTADAPDSVSD